MKKRVSFLIAVVFIIFITCGCYSTSSVKDASSIAPPSTFACSDNIVQKTDELKNYIGSKNNLYEQVKSSLDIIDSKHSDYLIEDFSKFAINKLKDFLQTEQAFNMTEKGFMELSDKIHLLSFSSARIITYEGSMLLFGESGAPTYAFLQRKVNGNIQAELFYSDNHRYIEHAIQPFTDKNLIVLTGRDKNSMQYRAFIDAYSIETEKIKKVTIISDYDDGLWNINSNEGLISLANSFTAATYINKTPGETIEVEAGNAKIVLSMDNKIKKYVIEKH